MNINPKPYNTCRHCGVAAEDRYLDSLELCPDCQKLDLVECAGCGDIYDALEINGDDCKYCIRKYNNA